MHTYSTLYKVWAAVEGEPASLRDAISYQFEPYLVPAWEEGPDGAWRRPERIVPLKPFGATRLTDDPRGADFEVMQPVPREAWSGAPSDALRRKYGILFRPPAKEWRRQAGT
jgi:hypothetical protein